MGRAATLGEFLDELVAGFMANTVGRDLAATCREMLQVVVRID